MTTRGGEQLPPHEVAWTIEANRRLEAYMDSLSFDEAQTARAYVGQPLEIMFVKLALRLEAHITMTEHAVALEHGHMVTGRAFGAGLAATLAATAGVWAAFREAFK